MMVEAFSHQIFLSGWVCARIALLFRTLGEEIYQVVARIAKSFAPTQIHADPHPGNMLVRRRPCAEHRESRSHTLTDTQLVILDHGMYLNCSEEFRRDYCALWKAMVLLDTPRVEAICRSWGISDANFFASLQLLKPFSPQNNAVHLNATTKAEVYEMQIEAYERVKQLLADSQRVPLELILLGRNLNIVRANNKGMGSPVNRVSIMAWFAARGACAGVPPLLGDEEELLQWRTRKDDLQTPPVYGGTVHEQPAGQNLQTIRGNRRALLAAAAAPLEPLVRMVDWEMMFFRGQLAILEVAYYSNQLWRLVNSFLFGRDTGGFEEILERSVSQTVEARLGFKLNFDEGVEKCFG